MQADLKDLTEKDLLQLYSNILEELYFRKIIRTQNNPVSDYSEWLVANRLGLTLATNSMLGYDATDSQNLKYQIKSRRITPRNPSTQLGVIRNLDKQEFHFLVALLYSERFEVSRVVKCPHEIISKYAKFSPHQNGHILFLRDNIICDPLTEDLTQLFK